MTVLAVAIAGYGVMNLLLTERRPEFVRNLFATRALPTFAHLAGGPLALVTGALQLNGGIRSRFLNFHRWTGRLYLIAVLIGGVSGLALALRSFGGMTTHLGFGMLAVLWLGTSAFRRILARDVTSHRRWMIRSYALTLAAVTLRIYLPLSQVAGIPFEQAYMAISWLAWVPNLLLAEWYLMRHPLADVIRTGGTSQL
jgi:hypothetical protein